MVLSRRDRFSGHGVTGLPWSVDRELIADDSPVEAEGRNERVEELVAGGIADLDANDLARLDAPGGE